MSEAITTLKILCPGWGLNSQPPHYKYSYLHLINILYIFHLTPGKPNLNLVGFERMHTQEPQWPHHHHCHTHTHIFAYETWSALFSVGVYTSSSDEFQPHSDILSFVDHIRLHALFHKTSPATNDEDCFTDLGHWPFHWTWSPSQFSKFDRFANICQPVVHQFSFTGHPQYINISPPELIALWYLWRQ